MAVPTTQPQETSPPPTPAVVVDGVTKRFRRVHQASSLKRAAVQWLLQRRSSDEITALDDVSFTVERGGSLGVVGRNGSGKSTVLALLAGIYRPSEGQITVRGRIATLLDVGSGFHPELTAEDNAIVHGMIHGLTRKESLDKVPEIIRFAGLDTYADTRVKHFSAGMALRLGFASVVLTRPDVLLVDEILAVGDEAFQRRCRRTIRDLQGRGTTVVFVSHDLEAIAETCDRCLWIDRGRLAQDGPTADVLAAYRAAAEEGGGPVGARAAE